MAVSVYRGRFAPSPTGPLHLGSLSAALASFLDARAADGTWLLRIEDIDPPREQHGAAQRIISSLLRHALYWDGDPIYQSRRHDAYEQVMSRLLADGHAFHCTCSRKDLQAGHGRHASACPRSRTPPPGPGAIRLEAAAAPYRFNDLILGEVRLPRPSGDDDFVLRRRDGLYAYQLAVVVDDAQQGITHVVRGRDLLDSTPHQILLHALLGRPAPRFGHVPLLLGPRGEKLSKQNHAPALDDMQPEQNLLQCLNVLGQVLPPLDIRRDCSTILRWAIQHWQRASVPHCDRRVPS